MIPNSETIARAKEILSTIESLQAELASMFGGAVPVARRGRPAAAPAATAAGAPAKKKRRMSAAGRAAIVAAAKARWARFRSEKEKKSK